MDSAHTLARRMLNAVNISNALLEGIIKGFIAFPVDMYYLGHRMLDTDNTRLNEDDTYRFAWLVKSGGANRKGLEEAARPFLQMFFERVDYKNFAHAGEYAVGSLAGKTGFTAITGINLGKVISNRLSVAIVSGLVFGTVIAIGGESSRAIYTSRALALKYPIIQQELKAKGNLDLLYFLVEERVQPFIDACEIPDKNEFDRVCQLFFEGLQ